MTETIARLWNWRIETAQVLGRNNDEIKELEEILSRLHERLENNFDSEQKQMFEKYYSNTEEYIMLSLEQAFCDGFCLGAKIIAEVFTGADDIVGDV